MNLVEKAALVSRTAHLAHGDKRKFINTPYHYHPEIVAKMIKVHGGSAEMMAAAYLHDVVEDTEIEHEFIRMEFGIVVAELVFDLTDQFSDPELGSREYRTSMERRRLSLVSAEAQTIKYADLIDNTRSIVQQSPKFAKKYLPEKEALLEVMDKGDSELYRLAWDTLRAAQGELKQHAITSRSASSGNN